MTEIESRHMALLQKWRTAMNLVGPGPVEPHFVDARQAVDGLLATGRWADLGSGAGFPGVALAEAYPALDVLLVESRSKRATFLKQVLRETGLDNASVFHGRTEDLSPGFDGLISRAYRPPQDVLSDADRLLTVTGCVVMLTSKPWSPPAGWVVHSTHRYTVTDGDRVRTVLVRDAAATD